MEQTKLQAHLEHGAPWQVDGKGVAYVWGVLVVVEHVRADQEETQKQEGAGPAKKEMGRGGVAHAILRRDAAFSPSFHFVSLYTTHKRPTRPPTHAP